MRCAGAPHLVGHRLVGEHGDPVPAFDQPAHDAELGRNRAARVGEREQVGAGVTSSPSPVALPGDPGLSMAVMLRRR